MFRYMAEHIAMVLTKKELLDAENQDVHIYVLEALLLNGLLLITLFYIVYVLLWFDSCDYERISDVISKSGCATDRIVFCNYFFVCSTFDESQSSLVKTRAYAE